MTTANSTSQSTALDILGITIGSPSPEIYTIVIEAQKVGYPMATRNKLIIMINHKLVPILPIIELGNFEKIKGSSGIGVFCSSQ